MGQRYGTKAVHTCCTMSVLVDVQVANTVMCLSIWTPITINFPFVANVKFIIFRCPNIWAYYSLIIMCSNIGTPKNH